MAHIKRRLKNFQTIRGEQAVRQVTQKQQIAGAERVKHGQVHLFSGAPQAFDQRSGIEFAIKREKHRDAFGFHHRREAQHTGSGLFSEMRLLVSRQRATLLADLFTDVLTKV